MATKIAAGVVVAILFVVVTFAQESPQSAGDRTDGATNNLVHTISGHIEAGGKPVEAGRLLVYLPDDQLVGCIIKNGVYTLRNLPMVEFPVSIDGVTVHQKYSVADSGLTIPVHAKQNKSWDFNVMPLEPKTRIANGD